MNKRGYYFTLDAIIALALIFSVLLVVNGVEKKETETEIVQRDLAKSLTYVEVSELNDSYAEQLRDENKTNGNLTVIEQIAEFYAKDMSEGEELAESILNNLDVNKNIGIWVDDELIASKNTTSLKNASQVWTTRQIIRGIEKSGTGEGIRGYSARAYLVQSKNKRYHYLGGYAGEGNISLRVECEGEVKEAKLEIATNKDFDIYINGNYSGHYENSTSERNPTEYDLSSYAERFHKGENIVKLAGENLYVAGGFLKTTYNESQTFNQTQRYYFPGVEGLINIYDGFYIPGNLTNLEISLHMNNNYTSFLKIGNTTIFIGNTSGEETININNSYLNSKLNYSKLEKETIPLRLGMENISYTKEIRKNADVFSVTDLSGSMCGTCSGGDSDCCTNWFWDICNNDQQQCESCGGNCEDKIYEAKDANEVFVDSILNLTGNRAGLVGYRGSVSDSDCHYLSEDNQSLKNKVDDWYANGGTCICCGVNEAVDKLVANSSEDKERAVVVMSDGEATQTCSEQGTGDAKQDAIQAACDAYSNHEIVVHTVGFGADADETTLQAMADCTNGTYSQGNVSNIADIYDDIAENIIEASYEEQTINASDEVWTKLYSDSYIDFEYEKRDLPYGLLITSESDKFNSSSKTDFYVPENSTVVNARAVSYSGPKWTQTLEIKNNTWETVYNLSEYKQDYINLGDPYTVNIPPEKVKEGNNAVRMKTGLYPGNSSSSSASDKIIYTIIKSALGYSPISSTSKGCNWTIEFYDSTNMTIEIPEDNNNSRECYYTTEKISYDENDAIATATFELLKSLDFNSDDRIESKFSEKDLDIQTSGITGIPYTYGTEVEVRTWR